MKKFLKIIIAFLSAAFCSLLALSSVDNKIADLFQRVLPKLSEQPNVMMINVDDEALEEIGTWPFSREVYGDMLVNLTDLGAEAVVFDLSFLDKSPAKIDERYVYNELPSYINDDFDELDSSISYVMDSFADRTSGAAQAKALKNDLLSVSQDIKNRINTSVSYVIKSQDASFAESIKFFNKAYLTLTFDDSFAVPTDEIDEDTKESLDFIDKYIALENIEIRHDTKTPEYFGVQPAIHEFMVNAQSAGFVNADPDRDGYLRRVNLLCKYNGKYYGQLVFVPVLKHFGMPKIVVSDSSIILINARISDGVYRDIHIPRGQDGKVIIKYPPKQYNDYNSVSLWDIYCLSILEKEFTDNLAVMQDAGMFSLWNDTNPLEMYQSAMYLKEALYNGENFDEGITFENYSFYRKTFFVLAQKFMSAGTENTLVNAYEGDEETQEYIREIFNDVREGFNVLLQRRLRVQEKVTDSICIVGTNATSTTDFGLNQYQEHYPNPGVHYTILNQLLTQDFVDDSSIIFSIIIAFILSIAYGFISFKMENIGKQIVIGTAAVGGTVLVLLIIFMITKVYIGTAIPALSLVVTFMGITITNLIATNKDKKFIKSAFSQCLSPDVVDEIVKNPSSFKLGGQKVDMTAIFTDIQKFSSFSELLTAGQLVALLNFYLTEMSDIIMENRGTVDKYEGDAIVAFVGAPVKTKEHAALACRAAINMKKAEIRMNKYIEEIAAAEKPEDMDQETYEAFCIMVKNKKKIFTRIGLNSGEIVAGYMGSTNKKNYTMMGNNVNLASRLEGVNKQYRTGGILMSGATRKGLDENFIVRSLDRVQVVNVVTPIRLYELLDIKENADPSLIKYVEEWESTMKLFEAGNYDKALEVFKKLSAARPGDNVCKYYIELIEKFFAQGKYPTEADDFGVAYNPENPEGMNEMWEGTPYEIKGTFKLLQK